MNTKLTKKEQLSHLIIGIFNELGEVHTAILNGDVDGVCDEAGDVCWYIANMCTVFTFDFQDLEYLPMKEDSSFIVEAYRCAAELGGIVKKYSYQDHFLSKLAAYHTLFAVFANLMGILNEFGLTSEAVFKHNHAKLLKRYPEGFDPERSVNREEE
jgi:NTP pyrophosphatase (non-canonical NTP hydrolase)